MSKLIPLYAKTLKIDVANNHILYTTDVEAPKGILLLADKAGNRDLIFANQVHEGGLVIAKMKATRVPSKKYELNDQIGYLLVIDGEK